ncbi:pilin [[Clostridium] sordellii]|uniref:type II secretion system protein n=1 Tax=Paraclostridium sordellii TaxID=1505 RepID=UPI0005E11CB7|nr:prepilin-type N-terminal cleavage/methylation domain-containing protein [Paeniclostridium sordellii]CEQ20328.1 pilin [[Clostridium] sordellii] [Paeniclostridium sordellii]
MGKKFKGNKGFTLIELLVVISIIGILVVIAVPALFNSIKMSKIAKLEKDVDAIKGAVIQYKIENNKNPTWNKKDPIESKEFLRYIEGISQKSPIGGDYKLYYKSKNTSPGFIKLNKIDDNGNLVTIDEDIIKPGDIYLMIESGDSDLKITKKQLQKLDKDLGKDRVYVSEKSLDDGDLILFIKVL